MSLKPTKPDNVALANGTFASRRRERFEASCVLKAEVVGKRADVIGWTGVAFAFKGRAESKFGSGQSPTIIALI